MKTFAFAVADSESPMNEGEMADCGCVGWSEAETSAS